MYNRFALKVLAVGSIVLIPSIGCWSAEKVRFGTSVKANVVLYALPVATASEMGFWSQQGLEVEWVPFDQATPFYAGMAARSVHMGLSGAGAAIAAAGRGLPVVIVADLGATDRWYLWVLTGSRFNHPENLKGTKIGITRFGGLVHTFAILGVKSLGLEKARIVAAGGSLPLVAALKSGQVDAMAMSLSVMMPLKYEGEARELADLNQFLPRPWTEVAMSARRDYVEVQANLVRRVARGLLEATGYIHKNREWAVRKMTAMSGYPRGAAEYYYTILNYSQEGKIRREVVEVVRKFMIDYRLVLRESTPAADQLYVDILG